MSARAKTVDAGRRADLAAIHVGKKALGLDDDAYRLILEQISGKSSAADLSPAERGQVLDCFRDLGFERKGGSEGVQRTRRERATQADVVRAIWGDLKALGQLRDPSERGLARFVERQTSKSRLEWCTPQELNLVIEGLKAWRTRTVRSRGGA